MAALARTISIAPLQDGRAHVAFEQPLDPRGFLSVSCREEAEYLLMLDHMKIEFDGEWTAFLVERYVEFLIWQQAPMGRIAEHDLDWVMGLMADAPSPSTPAILFALVRELNVVPERLMALAMKCGRNRLPG